MFCICFFCYINFKCRDKYSVYLLKARYFCNCKYQRRYNIDFIIYKTLNRGCIILVVYNKINCEKRERCAISAPLFFSALRTFHDVKSILMCLFASKESDRWFTKWSKSKKKQALFCTSLSLQQRRRRMKNEK